MMEKLVIAFLGAIIGGTLGFFGGIVWYELVEVPKAAAMDPMYAQTYLCSAGNGAPILFAMLGALVGTIVLLAWSTTKRQSTSSA